MQLTSWCMRRIMNLRKSKSLTRNGTLVLPENRYWYFRLVLQSLDSLYRVTTIFHELRVDIRFSKMQIDLGIANPE